jgi:hypothetical protein
MFVCAEAGVAANAIPITNTVKRAITAIPRCFIAFIFFSSFVTFEPFSASWEFRKISPALDIPGRRRQFNADMSAWVLTAEAIDKLLAVLDKSRDAAGEKYEHVRRALIVYFRSRQCSSPVDLADETINRVARKIEEGGEIWTDHPERYFLGVARNVLREQWDKPKRETVVSELKPSQQPKSDPAEVSRTILETRRGKAASRL